MIKLYRINKDVKPYPGKVFQTKSGPDEQGRIWGHVRIDFRRTSGLKHYSEDELTFVGEEKEAA